MKKALLLLALLVAICSIPAKLNLKKALLHAG
jgi:hypothetical protein